MMFPLMPHSHEQGRTPGAYINLFSPAMRAIMPELLVRLSTPRPSARLSLEQAVSLYETYLECAPGVDAAVVRTCPPGAAFAPANGTCVHLPPRHDTTSRPVPGCADVACFCTGRPNGMYPHPNNATAGVICGGGQPWPFSCPAGFPFTPRYGCAQLGGARQSPRPLRP